MSAADMKETEENVRERLATNRLHAPLNKEGINLSQQRGLRRVLARILTVRTERQDRVTTPAVKKLPTAEAIQAQEMRDDE